MPEGPLDILRARLKAFIVFLRPRLLGDGIDEDRLTQLRRLSDLRIRKFSVGRPRITGLDLCALLADPKVGSFSELAESTGIVRLGHLASPLALLGEDMGLVVEACLLHQVLGLEKASGHARAYVLMAGPIAAPAGVFVAGGAKSGPAPLPPAVDKLLGPVKDLWSLPAPLAKTLELLGDANTPADAICVEMQKESALAEQFLRIVNASPYGAAGRIGSLKAALVAIGYPVARRFAMIAGLLSKVAPPESQIDLRAFWTRVLKIAHAAAQIARQSKMGHPDEHFAAGMLHSVGALVVARHLPSGETPGTSPGAIGACVLERWRFPAATVEAARRHAASVEELEELQVPREAIVVAALHHLVDAPWELPAWAGFLRLAGDIVPRILQQAAPQAARSVDALLSDGGAA